MCHPARDDALALQEVDALWHDLPPEGAPLVPSRRQNDPLAPSRRGLPLLRRFTGASAVELARAAADRTQDVGSTGAADAAAWEAALASAAADPRARPLSAVRLLVEAPGLTGADRAEEFARLQRIAAVQWREILRPADTLAQVGESEFAVLLPRCDDRAAQMIAGRLQQAVPEAARCRAGVATSARGDAPRLAADASRALATAKQRRDPLADPGRLRTVAGLRLALQARAHTVHGPTLDRLAEGVATLLRADAVVISLVADQLLHPAGSHGLTTLGADGRALAAELTLCRHAVASGRPVLVSDTARHGVAGSAEGELRLGIAACASVPVTVDRAVVGTVCALRRERYEWPDDDTAVLRVAAERAERELEAALRSARTHGAPLPA